MNECPLEHHVGFRWKKDESVEDVASHHAHLSMRGKRVLDRLLVLLPSHLKLESQLPSRASRVPPTLLFTICDAFQLDSPDVSPEQNDSSARVLPSVLSKLRDWRLLDQDHRYSNGGIHKLAFDLAGIIDEASGPTSSDLNRPGPSHARLRMKWVNSDLPSESQDQGSSSSPPSSTPPSPSFSSSRSSLLDSAQQRAHAPLDLNERRSDVGCASLQVGRRGTPDSEDAGVIVMSPRHRSVSGFRSGCSACRHFRLSSPTSSTPSSPRTSHAPLSDVDADLNAIVSPPKKTTRDTHASHLSTGIDENEPPLCKPTTVQRGGLGILFPRQRTHSPRISNALRLPREPLSPVAASSTIQRRPTEPHQVAASRLSNQARARGDKRTTSHRVASVDLRSTLNNRASPNDLHPHPHPHAPTRAQSFSCRCSSPTTRAKPVVVVGKADAGVSKLSSNTAAAEGSRSSHILKRLPSWTRTHLERNHRHGRLATTPTLAKSVPTTRSLPSPGAHAAHLLPLGARPRPSSTSIPRPPLPAPPSQTHKHASSLGALPSSSLQVQPASPRPQSRWALRRI